AEWRPDEAIAHLHQAPTIEPKSALIHNNLGMALHAKGRLDEANDRFRQALSIEPRSALIHNNFGMALRDDGRLEEAIDHLQQAVRFDDHKSSLVQTNLGLTLYLAACAAVRAAAGQGSENGPLGEPKRAGKRRQALDRLRASLDLSAQLRRDGKAEGWSIATWQTDPALASVRDPAALARLP